MSRRRKEPNLSTYAGRTAARLCELMDARGMDVAGLAERLGQAAGRTIPLSTMYSYLSGERDLPLDLMPAVATVFGYSTASGWLPTR